MTFARRVVATVAGGYTGGMTIDWKRAARELLLSPLAWASYLAWGRYG